VHSPTRARDLLIEEAPVHAALEMTSSRNEFTSLKSAAHSSSAQTAWSSLPLPARVAVLQRTRHVLATQTDQLTRAISPTLARTSADTLAAEVLPLLAACRFLERNAASVLQTRRLGRSGRPAWLPGITSVIERVPLGTILVIGPSNYPLFLPGVQAIQALVAGNAVVWKPGGGGHAVALVVADAFAAAGLPAGLLRVTEEAASYAEAAIEFGIDKIVLTGSAETGRAVLHRAAEKLTPVIAELSGADALIVLPSSDVNAVTDAITFGMRLNGSATCMAPRRLLLVGFSQAARQELLQLLVTKLAGLDPTPLSSSSAARLQRLLVAAQAEGGTLLAGGWAGDGRALHPTVIVDATPHMALCRSDIFAPVLSVIDVPDEPGVLAAQRSCPLALTASIFGDTQQAQRLARKLTVGIVLINDVIVATADPRLPFGGRAQSGFGATRGAEGLLEMTVPRAIVTQNGRGRRRFEPTGALHIGLFTGLAALLYAGTWRQRWHGLRVMASSGRALTTARRQIRQSRASTV